MSFTLTDTQAVPALRLLQQPGFHQDRSLEFLYSTPRIENLDETDALQLLYSCEGRKCGGGTNPLIIVLPNM